MNKHVEVQEARGFGSPASELPCPTLRWLVRRARTWTVGETRAGFRLVRRRFARAIQGELEQDGADQFVDRHGSDRQRAEAVSKSREGLGDQQTETEREPRLGDQR